MNARIAIAVAPLVFGAALWILASLSPDAYRWFVIEDGPVENATAIAYLVAAVISVMSFSRLNGEGKRAPAALVLFFAGACFFVGMEELSWGQRLIGYGTPDWLASRNAQGEVSIHNIGGLQHSLLHPAYIVVGFAGSIGALMIPTFVKNRVPELSQMFIPGRQLFFYFLPSFAFYFTNEIIHPYTKGPVLEWLRSLFGTNDYMSTGPAGWMHQEPVELILAVAFLGLALQIRNHVRKHRSGGSGAAKASDVRADL